MSTSLTPGSSRRGVGSTGCEKRIVTSRTPRAWSALTSSRHEKPVPHDRDAITHVLHFLVQMRQEEDRCPLPCHLTYELLELVLEERVETRRGLVEHQQLGAVHERLDQRDLLPVAAGQASDRSLDVESEALRELVTPICINAAA
jgi:hypothetical protein